MQNLRSGNKSVVYGALTLMLYLLVVLCSILPQTLIAEPLSDVPVVQHGEAIDNPAKESAGSNTFNHSEIDELSGLPAQTADKLGSDLSGFSLPVRQGDKSVPSSGFPAETLRDKWDHQQEVRAASERSAELAAQAPSPFQPMSYLRDTAQGPTAREILDERERVRAEQRVEHGLSDEYLGLMRVAAKLFDPLALVAAFIVAKMCFRIGAASILITTITVAVGFETLLSEVNFHKWGSSLIFGLIAASIQAVFFYWILYRKQMKKRSVV